MPRALQAGETGGGSGRWGGIGRQRWHIHAAVSEHADGDGLALLQQAKDLLRRAESGEREFAERGEFTAAMPREFARSVAGQHPEVTLHGASATRIEYRRLVDKQLGRTQQLVAHQPPHRFEVRPSKPTTAD